MNSFIILMQALPAIIAAVKAVEAAVPMSGAGKAKLDAVLSIVTTAESSLSGMVPQITAIITTLVGLFNTSSGYWCIIPPANPTPMQGGQVTTPK